MARRVLFFDDDDALRDFVSESDANAAECCAPLVQVVVGDASLAPEAVEDIVYAGDFENGLDDAPMLTDDELVDEPGLLTDSTGGPSLFGFFLMSVGAGLVVRGVARGLQRWLGDNA